MITYKFRIYPFFVKKQRKYATHQTGVLNSDSDVTGPPRFRYGLLLALDGAAFNGQPHPFQMRYLIFRIENTLRNCLNI